MAEGPFTSEGIFPSHWLRQAVDSGLVSSAEYRIPDESFQPASLDLRLGPKAYRPPTVQLPPP